MPQPGLDVSRIVRGVTGRHYRVVRLLGSGGQVLAWLAEEAGSRYSKYYVIREPKPGLPPKLYSLTTQRLRITYRILYRLLSQASPAALLVEKVVDYYDEKPLRDYFLLITEYVYGELLEKSKECIDGGFGSECHKLIRGMFRAVEFIHRNGVIHRDIKPKNIIRAYWGPVLIDFTTAKYFYEITLYDVHVYSPGGYTAPEQMKGIVSTQSDLWSVGATILFLLTRQVPQRFLTGYPENPIEFNPKMVEAQLGVRLDYGVAELVKHLLHPNPAYRPLTREEAESLLEKGELLYYKEPVISLFARRVGVITGDRIVLGRAGDADIHVDLDPYSYVSRYHALLFKANGEWYIQDLCSTNGTAVYRYGVDTDWKVVWPGRAFSGQTCKPGTPRGTPVPLGKGALIALGYRSDLGPYLVAVFRPS